MPKVGERLPGLKRFRCWMAGQHDWEYVNTLFGRAYFRCRRCQVVRSRPAVPENEEKKEKPKEKAKA